MLTPRARGQLRILLVDDDSEQRALVGALLTAAYGEAFSLEWAPDYESALAAVEQSAYDICLIDHYLGRRTGVELMRELASRPSVPPCVMLTAARDHEVEAAAVAAGAADYLEKEGLSSRLLQRSIRYSLDRRRASDALRSSEQRYRALLENAAEAVLLLDAHLRPVYATGALSQIVGYSLDELTASDPRALLHPQDLEATLAALDRSAAHEGSHETIETRYRHRDGSWRWLQCVFANRLNEPAVRGIVANVRDVTENVLMMKALRLQAEVGRVLADAVSADAVRPALLRTIGEVLNARVVVKWRLDEQGGPARMIDTWGRPSDEPADMFIAMRRSAPIAIPAEASSNGLAPARPVFVENPGHEVPMVLIVPVERPGSRSRGVLEIGWSYAFEYNERLLNMVQEIARQIGHCLDRIETECALAERDAQLRALFDRGSDAILISGENDVFVDVNPAAERLFGVPREQLIGSRLRDFLAPESRTTDVGELVVMTARNERRVVDFRVMSDFMPDRDLSLLRDVTDQRQLEHQLLHAQKMDTIGRLTGGIAHDFNNLLTVIGGNAEMLRSEAPLSHGHTAMLDEILKASASAAAMTRQLLAFSRKQVMKATVFDLNEAVVGMERMLRRLIGEHIRFETAFAPDLPPIEADPAQLEQVLVNLAVNARDAMPDGGTLTIETRVIEDGGRFVVLTVADTGVGIDPDTLPRIFEPFFTTKGPGEGTGLGLATVYGIVRQSGGEIRVASHPGEGSTFAVYLPAVSRAGRTNQAAKPAFAEGGSETVLVVEDAEPVRRLTAGILRRAGYHVIEAANGEEACARVFDEALQIDLLLTDMVMPGISGAQLHKRLAATHPELRVIYCSGYTADSAVSGDLPAQGRGLLQKPYTRAALLGAVRQVLNAVRLDDPEGAESCAS